MQIFYNHPELKTPIKCRIRIESSKGHELYDREVQFHLETLKYDIDVIRHDFRIRYKDLLERKFDIFAELTVTHKDLNTVQFRTQFNDTVEFETVRYLFGIFANQLS